MLLRKQMEVHGNILFKYRGELPILLIPPGVYLLYRAITTHPQFDWQGFLSWYKFLCLGIVALGQMIRGYAHAHTALHTSGRNIHGQLANAVNNTGIYSVVRHPLYLGNYFMALGVAMLSCNVWFVADVYKWPGFLTPPRKITPLDAQETANIVGEYRIVSGIELPTLKIWQEDGVIKSHIEGLRTGVQQLLRDENTGKFCSQMGPYETTPTYADNGRVIAMTTMSADGTVILKAVRD